MSYSSEENLIIQSTCNAVFLASLSGEGKAFIESDFFKRMKFLYPKIKGMYESGQIGVDNQGMMLACLYSLLVLPKELILNKYSESYKKVNTWINEHKEETEIDTYSKNGTNYNDDLKHIMHLRNSISHGKVEFDDANRENVICIFKDDGGSGKYEYQLKLSVHNVLPLIQELCLAQQSYINDLIARDKKEKVSD